MSENKSVLYREEKGIARVTFNRPEALNAIDKDLLQQLASILDVAKKDEAVKAVIITGAGEKAFSAGADIRFLNHASDLEVRELAQLAVSVNNRRETMGKVVVAAINGHALGGGLELAESCMLRVAARQAPPGASRGPYRGSCRIWRHDETPQIDWKRTRCRITSYGKTRHCRGGCTAGTHNQGS